MVGEGGASSLATLPATPELMAYYQQRCDEFTRLEEDYLSRIQALEASVEERPRSANGTSLASAHNDSKS